MCASDAQLAHVFFLKCWKCFERVLETEPTSTSDDEVHFMDKVVNFMVKVVHLWIKWMRFTSWFPHGFVLFDEQNETMANIVPESSTFGTGVPRSCETAAPQDHTVGLCLGPSGVPGGGGLLLMSEVPLN